MPRRWFIRPNAGPGQVLGAAFAKGPIKCKEGYQTVEATALEIEQVNKWYAADVHAVRDVNLAVEPGEFMIFVGPSGCGKSTLLRLVAGLERVDSGVIRMDGKSIHRVPPRDRDIAMVFQNYALYPTMKVYDNRAFPLKMRRWGREEIRARVMEVAESLGLLEYLDRRPGALSGGQRQWRWDGPWCGALASSSWTSLSPTWTPSFGWICVGRSCRSSGTWAPLPSTSPTTRPRS